MTGAKMMCARHEAHGFHEIGVPCGWCEPEPRRVYSVPAPTFEVTTTWMHTTGDAPNRRAVEAPSTWADTLAAWCPSIKTRESFFGVDRATGPDVTMLGGVRYDTAPSFDDIAAHIKRLWRKVSDAEALLPTTPFVLVPRGAVIEAMKPGALVTYDRDCPPDYVYAANRRWQRKE